MWCVNPRAVTFVAALVHGQGAVARSSLAAKISAYNDANRCPTCQQAVYDGPDQSMVDGIRYHNVSDKHNHIRVPPAHKQHSCKPSVVHLVFPGKLNSNRIVPPGRGPGGAHDRTESAAECNVSH